MAGLVPDGAGISDVSKRPQRRVEVFKDAGYAIFVDEPERFNKLMADFVASTAAK